MNGAYYNEFDPHAAAWLRELIKGGHIADGDVDERSIIEVTADDVKGYRQQHFFAGIGGWSLAARLAGWPDDKPLFTGSPPCQPFSTAGKQLGKEDARHLAPHWLELARTVRPAFVAGEQVAAAVNKDAWLDDLLDALEAENYTTGAIVLPASFVGAPHIRQRIFFVGRLGDGERAGLEGHSRDGHDLSEPGRLDTQSGGPAAEAGGDGGMANNSGQRLDRGESAAGKAGRGGSEDGGSVGGMAESDSTGPRSWGKITEASRYRNSSNSASGASRDGECDPVPLRMRCGIDSGIAGAGLPKVRSTQGRGGDVLAACPTNGFWRAADWLLCRDGKWRPVEPGTFPLVNGLPRGVVYNGDPCNPGYANKTAEARVMRLKGYGNAIVPELAAEVLRELK